MVSVGAPEIAIELSVAAATVKGILPLTPPEVAVTVTGAALMFSAVAVPLPEIVVTAVFDDVHVAVDVRSRDERSL